MYSYAEDDTVEDPLLPEHLAHFGIDFSALRKVPFASFSGTFDNNRALTLIIQEIAFCVSLQVKRYFG